MYATDRLQNLEQYYDKQDVERLDVAFDEFKINVNHKLATEYNPYTNSHVGTFERFHKDNSLIKLIIGSFGSGKSTCCLHEIPLHCYYNLPKMKDGIRRARWAIVRNTMGELESTTLATWNSWFGFLGKIKRTKKPLLTYTHSYTDDKGDVELELIFIGLDREDDKQKLESLELTGAYLNELQHIPNGILVHIAGRIGRFPRLKDLDGELKKLIVADTNPPDTDHWIYKDFEENPIEGNTVFHQPPGLIKNQKDEWFDNPQCDNCKNISPTYYFDAARASHFREEFIKVYCRGEYGILIPGKPVYPEYNDDFHSVETVPLISYLPVVLQWDYGTTPCCLLSQFSEDGQKRNFKEFCTEKASVRSLAKDIVKPWIDTHLKGYEVISVGDPAGVAKSQNDGISVFNILNEIFEFETLPGKTNVILPRLEAVRAFLGRITPDGQPGYLLSRRDCPTLRKSMSGKYCYKRIRIIGDEKYKDIPDKIHPYSDIADADQYGALEYMGDGMRMWRPEAYHEDYEPEDYDQGRSEIGGY